MPLDARATVHATVTAIDANHCPGAVLLLFEGYFGRVLCTGDFRYCPAIGRALAGCTIDLAYIDNTYCTPTAVFPSRVRSETIELIKPYAVD